MKKVRQPYHYSIGEMMKCTHIRLDFLYE